MTPDDALLKELRAIKGALGNVLGLCAMPKKTEQALLQVHHRLSTTLLPYEPKKELKDSQGEVYRPN